MTNGVEPTATADVTGVVLVPDADFLYFLNDPDPPETDVLRELRLYYSSQYRATTLGPSEFAESLRTVAEFAASGVVGNFAYSFSKATLRYLARLASRPANSQIDADAAIRIALEVFALAIREPQPSTKIKVVDAVRMEGGGWRISLVRKGKTGEVYLTSSGVASVKVGWSATGGSHE